MVGSTVSDSATHMAMPPGQVRGYDARNGHLRCIFHTIPQIEDLGLETWEEEPGAVVDPETGVIYIPSITVPIVVALGKPDPNRSDMRYSRPADLYVEVPHRLLLGSGGSPRKRGSPGSQAI